MKKFSKITGQKISEEPKANRVKSINEEELFKSKIMTLLDQTLGITTYGPIGRYQSAGSIRINGKDLFVEALMDLLQSDKLKEEIKLLESLKSEIKDWEVIDAKIDTKLSQISRIEESSKLTNHTTRIKYLIDNYSDEDLILQIVETTSMRIQDEEVIKERISAAKNLLSVEKSDLISKIILKYESRLDELTK
jgi:hypothetical protein